MQDQTIEFETAKLAKEKGFKELADMMYDGIGKTIHKQYNYAASPHFFPQCSQTQLTVWLKKVHKLILIVSYVYELGSTPYIYSIYKEGHSTPLSEWINGFSTYEAAKEAGLIETLNIIQKEK